MRKGEQLRLYVVNAGGPGNLACASVDFLLFCSFPEWQRMDVLSEDAATRVRILYSSVSLVKLLVATDGRFMSLPRP